MKPGHPNTHAKASVPPTPGWACNSVGKHVRHILEFYELLLNSIQNSHLNYDYRQRDLVLEVDSDVAFQRISHIDRAISQLDLALPLTLEADLSVGGAKSILILTSLARELLYNVEHTIHHMALIQVAVKNALQHIELPLHFGVAYSTVQYQSH